MHRTWSKEEIEELEEMWGYYSIPAIAKRLDRSINAIKNKAYKIGLGRHLDSGNYISLNILMNTLGRRNGCSDIIDCWIKKGLPLKHKKVINMRYKVLKIDEFWEWAEKHRTIIDFSRLEKNVLCPEPEWVEKQRRIDIEAKRTFKKTPWTKGEDEQLRMLVKEQRYGYAEISKMIRRTEGAIKRRLLDLNIKDRPVKRDNHNKWKFDEINIVKDMYCKGYTFEQISERLNNRGTMAVRGKVERMIKNGEIKSRCNKLTC